MSNYEISYEHFDNAIVSFFGACCDVQVLVFLKLSYELPNFPKHNQWQKSSDKLFEYNIRQKNQ